MKLKYVYLSLSILGAIIPYVFFTQYFQVNGIHLISFINDLFGNGASGGFSADLLISSFVFWIFLFQDKNISNKWIFIALNLIIGLSCALPFYYYDMKHKCFSMGQYKTAECNTKSAKRNTALLYCHASEF